ncbi:hypothetical protein QP178_00470 [Sphingomonas aurantiaca]|uniref:hypothetical protein n=1 Tax=Sphingomonas aurantiaca TaxID=185949 RepID=UPI002FE1D85F
MAGADGCGWHRRVARGRTCRWPIPLPATPSPHKDPSAAGGFLVALGMLGGVGVGFAIGQSTPGFLVGTAIGVAAAVLVWLKDRR